MTRQPVDSAVLTSGSVRVGAGDPDVAAAATVTKPAERAVRDSRTT
ncbi:hypothetical protein [Streptomyces shenzhenensis]|nr:hypothetical protein [Streptomyces shenzhenensis]